MNLKQMTVFREVMLTGSVSEAARNLNRTQPAVSQMVASLEDELGMRLFERRRGRLHPVPEAQYLFKECDDLLSRVNGVSQNMKRMKAMESGELSVVSMPGPAAVLLPELICELAGAAPEVNATLLSRSSEAVAQLVASQQFDIGIADQDLDRPSNAPLIKAETLIFNCLCAVPCNSPLAQLKKITPADLADMPMATLFPEHRSFAATRRVFEAAGQPLNVRFVGQFFLPLLAYVNKGLAASVVDPVTAASWRESTRDPSKIVFLPFHPAISFGMDILLPAYRPTSVLARSFFELLFARLTKMGGVLRQG